jgi:uncharacterized membrane protein YfcA
VRAVLVYGLTYALAAFFAVAGMGAAGVLVPNYVMLGLPLPLALTLALTQNTFELAVATLLNHRRRLVDWRSVGLLAPIASALVPLGFYIHTHIPHVAVLTVFEVFLLYALYSLVKPSGLGRPARGPGLLQAGLAAVQGLIAGLIGMDAAPIAILAYSAIHRDPKRVSANTAATALIVSATALTFYARRLYSLAAPSPASLAMVGAMGLLGGVTGVSLMHRVKPSTVRTGMKALLGIAAAEVYAKVLMASYASTTILLETQSVIAVTLLTLAVAYARASKMAAGSARERRAEAGRLVVVEHG